MKYCFMNLMCLASALLLEGCASKPIYEAPLPSEPRAFVKFEYDSVYPISTGDVQSFDGEFLCGDHDLANSKMLYRHGRGNPLITDINPDGTWIHADKIINVRGYAITSYSARCKTAGSFIPKYGDSYTIRLVQTGEKTCKLEVINSKTKAQVKDFTAMKCENK